MKTLSATVPRAIILAGLTLACAAIQSAAVATTVTINPSDDGSIYENGGISHLYLEVVGTIRGVVEFPTDQITGAVLDAWLSVNPYALPLAGPSLALYGYESYDGLLTPADYDAGTFLGDWPMPEHPRYGQDIFFNVTTFLQQTSSPFLGFSLRTDGVADGVFSTLAINYGHPAQLTVTSIPAPVPEPPTYVLFLIGLAVIACINSRNKQRLYIPRARP